MAGAVHSSAEQQRRSWDLTYTANLPETSLTRKDADETWRTPRTSLTQAWAAKTLMRPDVHREPPWNRPVSTCHPWRGTSQSSAA